jgi:CheY-like chemotaxis protein
MEPQPAFLYVEDDAISRNIMKTLLVRLMGYKNLTIFEDSANFIAKVEGLPTPPDIFFLDIHMQPHTGFELLRQLRQHPVYQNKKVIALTASVMNEEVDELRHAGFDGGMAKPLDQNEFPDLVKRILNNERVWFIR